jgi:hypothetical protein
VRTVRRALYERRLNANYYDPADQAILRLIEGWSRTAIDCPTIIVSSPMSVLSALHHEYRLERYGMRGTINDIRGPQQDFRPGFARTESFFTVCSIFDRL